MRPITVAAVQAEAVPGDLAGDAARAAELARITAGQGATLAVLPELFFRPITRRVCDGRRPASLPTTAGGWRTRAWTRCARRPASAVPERVRVGSAHRRDVSYAARALGNTMYVVFANSVGGVEPWRFNGGAAIYDPEGRPLARAGRRG
ncbi:nitrilase-related carbon-nitrogen hydrolase [Micromonospora sp. CPCC 206061]|uniref:nitrilase-related carbon-nitrogen hydrolase n=1 Tax=Micromonospora sp. CPCC 206061 TaxID=3122410 RepID=UPI002FF2F5A4